MASSSSKLAKLRVPWWRERSVLLKSIGFELPFIFGVGRGTGESPKFIVSTNHKLALARCGIHLLPILVSFTILVLNLGNSYLGRGLPGSIIDPSINIALLQVAAKIQELLIVASVTIIVMHVLRSESISGEGLPLGLIGGGFLYTTMSYFWSPEFWGSFYTKYSSIARVRVYGILILGGFVAALAGPSTAVLLVPRDQPWPAGGTTIYLPGPIDRWWPARMESNYLGTADICQSPQASTYATCPSGGYPAFWSARNKIDVRDKKAFQRNSVQTLTTGFAFGPSTLDIPSNLDLLPTLRYHGNHRGYACETSMWGPRAAEAMYQAKIKQDWIEEAFAIPPQFYKYGPTLIEYKYFGSMQVTMKSRIPAVRSACLPAQQLAYGDRDLSFPHFSTDACWSTTDASLLTNVEDLNQTAVNHIRTTWTTLPTEFGAASGGLIVEMPQDDTKKSRAVVACTVDARWTSGNIITYHIEEMSSIEKVAAQILVTTALLDNPREASEWTPGYSDFGPVTESPSSESINLDKTWLDALTPTITLDDSGSRDGVATTLGGILMDLGYSQELFSPTQSQADAWNANVPEKVNRTVALEWWLALLVTDGLARAGSSEVLNMTSDADEWSLANYNRVSNFGNQLFSNKEALLPPNGTQTVAQRVAITIGGYSFRASSITDYASAALLLTHILMALIHTIYSIWWTGRSSSAWDSLTELMVLMQNSRAPLRALNNASAGIVDIATYSKRAKIFAVRSEDLSQQDRARGSSKVEMIFSDDECVLQQHDGSSAITDLSGIPDTQLRLTRYRNRRLESVSTVNSHSPLLAEDCEIANTGPSTSFTDVGKDSRTCAHENDKFEKVLPDVAYR